MAMTITGVLGLALVVLVLAGLLVRGGRALQ